MVANWDYTKFDPLRTADEYNQSYKAANQARNDAANTYSPQMSGPAAVRNPNYVENWRYGEAPMGAGAPSGSPLDATSSWRGGGSFRGDAFGGGQASMPSGYNYDTMPGYSVQSIPGSTPFMPTVTPEPLDPGPLYENLDRLHANKQLQQGNYSQMMGGGWAGGVLPSDMAQTYQSGGAFGADSRGVRPTNPFAQAPSYGAQQASAASYGRQGGLGGLGGFGGNDPFSVQNPYA